MRIQWSRALDSGGPVGVIAALESQTSLVERSQ